MTPREEEGAKAPASPGQRSGTEGAGGNTLSVRSIVAVAKKEFLDNVRSYWILGITAIFVILSLVISYFGAAQSGGGTGFRDPRDTAAGMMALSSILVPIIALMLGYGTIVTEREDGSLPLLLSMPITRLETMLGKFGGLSSVLAASIFAGLGIGGAIIVGAAGGDGAAEYLALMLGTVLLGMAFLAIAMLFSTLARSKGMALGLAVVIWFFFSIIFDVILIGVLIATGGGPQPDPGGGFTFVMPDWYFAAQMANPASAYGLFGSTALGNDGPGNSTSKYPGFVSPGIAGAAMLAWVAAPLLIAYWRLERQDL